MKPVIFVTRRLPEPVMSKLEETFTVNCNPHDRVLTKIEIIEGMKGCTILLCLLTDLIDRDVILSNPDLKGISNYAVGYNNIDMETANELRIPVCNTPGVLTETTADLAWALMMSIARRIVESDRFTRTGKFTGWAPLLLLGNDVYGKTLGIAGTGRIGAAVARRAVGFNMNIVCFDQKPNRELIENFKVRYTGLEELLRISDFVTLHLPLTDETREMIGQKEFSIMKKSSFLINTSRGRVIDEPALVRALESGEIAGAGLDVYYNEPELSPGLQKMDNVILASHIGSATNETRTKMGMLAAENARDMLLEKHPRAVVNPEVLSR